MGYQEAIEDNGVKVIEFKEFGSYQGTWIAILEDGRYVEGSYGSCSGCDAYQGEFGYSEEPQISDGKYYKAAYWNDENECTKEEYEQALIDFKEKHRLFGKSYLDCAETKEMIVSRYQKKCEGEYPWEDDKEILQWLLRQSHEPRI